MRHREIIDGNSGLGNMQAVTTSKIVGYQYKIENPNIDERPMFRENH